MIRAHSLNEKTRQSHTQNSFLIDSLLSAHSVSAHQWVRFVFRECGGLFFEREAFHIRKMHDFEKILRLQDTSVSLWHSYDSVRFHDVLEIVCSCAAIVSGRSRYSRSGIYASQLLHTFLKVGSLDVNCLRYLRCELLKIIWDLLKMCLR